MISALLKHSLELSPVRFCHNARESIDRVYLNALSEAFYVDCFKSLFVENKPPVAAIAQKKIYKYFVIFPKTKIEKIFRFSQEIEELYRNMFSESKALVVPADRDLISVENRMAEFPRDCFGGLERLGDDKVFEGARKSSSEDEKEARWNHNEWMLPLVGGILHKVVSDEK